MSQFCGDEDRDAAGRRQQPLDLPDRGPLTRPGDPPDSQLLSAPSLFTPISQQLSRPARQPPRVVVVTSARMMTLSARVQRATSSDLRPRETNLFPIPDTDLQISQTNPIPF